MAEKGKNRRSIYFYFGLAALAALLIILLIFSIWGYTLISRVRTSVLENYNYSLNLYKSQLEMELNQAEQYAYALPQNDYYPGIKNNGKRSSTYEYAKSNLALSIQGSELLINGIVDGFYTRISSTGDCIAYRNAGYISMEDGHAIEDWLTNQGEQSWRVETIGSREYLVRVIELRYTTTAILIRKDKVVSAWNQSFDSEVPLDIAMEFPEERGITHITQAFVTGGLLLGISIPGNMIFSSLRMTIGMLLAIAVAFLLLTASGIFLIRKSFADPLSEVEGTILKIGNGETDTRMPEDQSIREIYSTAVHFNQMIDRLSGLKIQTYELELENQKSRLINLQLQINPHLLLNSLNTIYGLAEVQDFAGIQKFSMNLVKYFRYSLKNVNEPVTLRKEIEFIQNYTAVQQVRYPNRFYVLYDVEEELMDEWILPLLIQNFVENSAKYALGNHEVEILVGARKDGDRLRISVTDDGRGIAPEILEQINRNEPVDIGGDSHIGIWNCRNRMKLFYGDEAKFSITSEVGAGTTVWMELPVISNGKPVNGSTENCVSGSHEE